MRRTFISTSWTLGVDPEDVRTLLRTIEDIYALLRRGVRRPDQYDPLPVVRAFGAWVIPALPQGAAYSSMEWYVERSLNDARDHILASRYMEIVQLEPWQIQSPHFDLCLTHLPILDDMSSPAPQGEALGFSRRGLVSLISTHPFDRFDDPALRRLAIEYTVAHYFGSLFDVPVVSRQDEVEEHHGEPYCTNVCARRYADTPDAALEFAREQAVSGIVYCATCQREMLGQITAFYYGVN